jgi:hypothetical protein
LERRQGVTAIPGSDRGEVNCQVKAMQQGGRWAQAIAEGQANKQAFEELRQASQPTATGSIYTRGY